MTSTTGPVRLRGTSSMFVYVTMPYPVPLWWCFSLLVHRYLSFLHRAHRNGFYSHPDPFSCPALSCLVLPCPALPCPALSCPALPYLPITRLFSSEGVVSLSSPSP